MKKILLFMIGVIFLAGCSEEIPEQKQIKEDRQDKVKVEELIHSFKHPETEQSYKIIDAYKLFYNYIIAIEEDPESEESALYKQEIIDPLYQECFAGGEFPQMAETITEQVPYSLEKIEILNEKIESSEYLDSIKEALIKSSELLPSDKETNVCIFPHLNKRSAGAVTVGAERINVLYSPLFTQDYLKTAIAHEYHHSFWAEHFFNDERASVLDNLVFEGKAVMFEKIVYPDLEGTHVNDEYNKDYWTQIQNDLNEYDYTRSSEILFGGNGLPQLYGYMEGYKMVKSFLDLHPDSKPIEWTGLSGKEIFEEGKYTEHYQ
jgi:hypothetical protein